jgi:hypothetical protein
MRTLALMQDRVYRDDTFADSFGSTVTPILDPGDSLVFDQFTLHRAQHSAASDFVRISFYQDADVAAIILDQIVIRKISESSTTRSPVAPSQRCQLNCRSTARSTDH